MRSHPRAPWFSLAIALPILILGILSLPSCIVAEPGHEVMMEGSPGAEVVVNDTPPAPREEVMVGVAPAPNYVWVGGYWTWSHSNWYWVRGQWVARPRPSAVWVAGHWQPRGRGHVWIGGYWR